MLGELGLDQEAKSAYRLMLENPGWGVEQLQLELGLDARAVRGLLDRLADLALLRPSLTVPGAMRPVPPGIALDALQARQQAELARTQHQIEESRAAVASLLSDYSSLQAGQSSGGVERIVGLDAIRGKLEELAFRARRENLAFAPGGPQTPENRAASRPLAEAAFARGVKLKTVYLDSVTNDPGSREHAEWLAAHGCETRTTPSLPMRMHIVDREIGLVPLDPQDTTKGAVLIREPGALAGFCALFDQVWAGARPLGQVAVRDEGEVASPQEVALLRLLADGLTDEAAARKLGISLRTERRMITELSNRLGAGSRFQLGQRAAELGILQSR